MAWVQADGCVCWSGGYMLCSGATTCISTSPWNALRAWPLMSSSSQTPWAQLICLLKNPIHRGCNFYVNTSSTESPWTEHIREDAVHQLQLRLLTPSPQPPASSRSSSSIFLTNWTQALPPLSARALRRIVCQVHYSHDSPSDQHHQYVCRWHGCDWAHKRGRWSLERI